MIGQSSFVRICSLRTQQRGCLYFCKEHGMMDARSLGRNVVVLGVRDRLVCAMRSDNIKRARREDGIR